MNIRVFPTKRVLLNNLLIIFRNQNCIIKVKKLFTRQRPNKHLIIHKRHFLENIRQTHKMPCRVTCSKTFSFFLPVEYSCKNVSLTNYSSNGKGVWSKHAGSKREALFTVGYHSTLGLNRNPFY